MHKSRYPNPAGPPRPTYPQQQSPLGPPQPPPHQQPPYPEQPPPPAQYGNHPQQQQQLLHTQMSDMSIQPQNGLSPPGPGNDGNGHMAGRPPPPGIRPQPPSSATFNSPYQYQQQPQQPTSNIGPPPPPFAQQQQGPAMAQRPLRPASLRPAPPAARPYPNGAAQPPTPQQPQPYQDQNQIQNQQQQQPQPQQQQAPQISPLVVPRPSLKVCGVPRNFYYRGVTSHPDERGMTLPSSNTDFITIDDGNAPLRYARLTTNAVATDPPMMTKSHVPFAIMITPFATPVKGEQPIPTIDFSSNNDQQQQSNNVQGPLRCERCNAYANPGFKFLNGGQEFQCNLCANVCSTPQEHFSPVGHTGLRMDVDSRPELRLGSVDYIVGSPDYYIRTPKPAKYIFAVDVSAGAVQSGLASAALQSIKSCITAGLVPGCNNQGGDARIAIITFDKALHFFDGRESSTDADDDGKQVRMHLVPDVMDPFVPIGGNALFLSANEAAAAVDTAMEMHHLIPSSNASPETVEPAPAECVLGSALHAIKEAFMDYGGKAFVVCGSIPTYGVNRLERRGGGAMGGGEERELSLLREANASYDILGCELGEVQASVDLFLAPSSVYVDVSTLSRLPRACGGKLFTYTGFDAVRDGASLHRAVCAAASEARAFEALMRIRTSPGVEAKGEYIGHFGRPQRGDDLSGPVFDASSTLGLEMSVVSKLENKDDNNNGYNNGNNTSNLFDQVCVQCATLYTDCNGLRRIRVHTVFARKTTVMADMFSCADVDATATFLAKRVCSAVLVAGTPFSKAWDGIMQKMAQMFYMYRKHCTSSSVTGQLILPESYKVLPLMMLGLIKSAALRKTGGGGDAVTVDERAAALSFVITATVAEVAAFCYPRIWDISDLSDKAGIPLPPPKQPGVAADNDSIGTVSGSDEPTSMPDTIPASAVSLGDDKVMMMENGMQLVVWVGTTPKEGLANEIFTMGPGGRILIRGETANCIAYVKEVGDLGKRVAKIVQRVCGERKWMARPVVVERNKPGAGGEARWVLPLLVEDRSVSGMFSYMEYLRNVHKEVMDRMANDSAQSDLATWEMLNHGY